jgi:hypothetical protein
VLAVLVLGYVSGGVAGVLVYGRWMRPALIGLSMVGTVLMLYVVLRVLPGVGDAANRIRPGWRPRLMYGLVTCGVHATAALLLLRVLLSPLAEG